MSRVPRPLVHIPAQHAPEVTRKKKFFFKEIPKSLKPDEAGEDKTNSAFPGHNTFQTTRKCYLFACEFACLHTEFQVASAGRTQPPGMRRMLLKLDLDGESQEEGHMTRNSSRLRQMKNSGPLKDFPL